MYCCLAPTPQTPALLHAFDGNGKRCPSCCVSRQGTPGPWQPGTALVLTIPGGRGEAALRFVSSGFDELAAAPAPGRTDSCGIGGIAMSSPNKNGQPPNDTHTTEFPLASTLPEMSSSPKLPYQQPHPWHPLITVRACNPLGALSPNGFVVYA